jgi:hypothetical protein
VLYKIVGILKAFPTYQCFPRHEQLNAKPFGGFLILPTIHIYEKMIGLASGVDRKQSLCP